MKKAIISLILFSMLFSLFACGNSKEKTGITPFATVSETRQSDMGDTAHNDTALGNSEKGTEDVLVAYFSRIGNTDFPDGTDALTSASLMVENDKIYGNTQYLAMLIQQAAGGDVFLIEIKEKYSADYNDTVDIAQKEEENNERPQLASHVENMEDYQVIFLGFPNWWYNMPMSVYSFLEEYDLSGKTIIPFVTSGGSGFSDAIDSIKKIEPDANVIQNGFETTHSEIKDVTVEEVQQWVDDLKISELEKK